MCCLHQQGHVSSTFYVLMNHHHNVIIVIIIYKVYNHCTLVWAMCNGRSTQYIHETISETLHVTILPTVQYKKEYLYMTKSFVFVTSVV